MTDTERLVRDPHFHQQNVYAITMATLYEFECALGRTVDWGFDDPSHQLKVAPHAFADGNAYYSRESESLNFGYFPDERGQMVYTCLSHDIVVHETTHALLDGLRSFYLTPSSADQAGFHEGFADIVALLSVFRDSGLVEHVLAPMVNATGRVPASRLNPKDLGETALLKLAEEMGEALSTVRGEPLRHSIKIKPSRAHYTSARFEEEHDRGELLVAIIMQAFLKVWVSRLEPLIGGRSMALARSVIAEEGSTAAKQLLRIVIRALDYMPPVDMTYRDYLSALLTADMQLYPDDTRYRYRERVKASFAAFGIDPPVGTRRDGAWSPPPDRGDFTFVGTHFERMQRDPAVVFRFIWENRDRLDIERDAFTRVISVRPVVRVSNDQMVLRETVAEYVQTLKIYASELAALGIKRPEGMPTNRLITLYGGGTLIFDQYGRLKFHVGTGVRSKRQTQRLRSIWEHSRSTARSQGAPHFALLHQCRASGARSLRREEW